MGNQNLKDLFWFVEKRHAVSCLFSVPWKKRWDHTAQVPLTGEELPAVDSTGERLQKILLLSLDDHIFLGCAPCKVPTYCLVGQIQG